MCLYASACLKDVYVSHPGITYFVLLGFKGPVNKEVMLPA